MLPWFAACAPADTILVEPTAPRTVELILDRGHFDGEDWVSEPSTDRVLDPPTTAGQGPDRRWTTLPPGPSTARVGRACGEVVVPFVVATEKTIVLPYPACSTPDAPPVPGRAALLDRRELSWAEVAAAARLGLWPEIPPPEPGAENGPARYVTYAEARAICAWKGGRLPTEAEWRLAAGLPIGSPPTPRLAPAPTGPGDLDRQPSVGPAGHEDLSGNVEEWLAEGTVAGGSWLRADTVRAVPAQARAETLGLRCAWDPR